MSDAKDDIYDYVVIGGGTSGSVAARRLAEADGNFSVCLLEAGPSNKDVNNSHMPGGWATLRKTPLDWCYETIPQKGLNNRVVSLPRGRLLGGSSAMNATFFTRGAKGDYDHIVKLGNPGWSWDEMLPFFKASETFHSAEWIEADLTVHGTDGPLHTAMKPLAPISEKVLESFIDSGFEYKPDMFAQGHYEGVGHAPRTVYKGIRTTSADFLHSYKSSNLTVKTGIYVDRIILEKNNHEEQKYKAIGVEAHDDTNGQQIIIKARKEIILSAGTYNSPMILMHSGIGCAKHLAEVGIDCKIDLPGIGSNLIDHVVAYVPYEVSDPNLTNDRFIYHHQNALNTSVQEWIEKKTGVMAAMPAGCAALARIDKTIQDPVWEAFKAKKQHENGSNYDPAGLLPNQSHVEITTTEFYVGAPHFLNTDGLPFNPVNGEGIFTLVVFLFVTQAKGTVKLSSNDPTSKPIIDHAYLDNDIDVTVLAEGCRLGHQILMKGQGTKDLIVGPWPRTNSYSNDLNGWKEHVRTFLDTGFHPAGTCKMAPDSDPMGVVDSRLRLRNVHGLRVADISILPILISGHTQAPAYAIGEKVAHMILQDANSSK